MSRKVGGSKPNHSLANRRCCCCCCCFECQWLTQLWPCRHTPSGEPPEEDSEDPTRGRPRGGRTLAPARWVAARLRALEPLRPPPPSDPVPDPQCMTSGQFCLFYSFCLCPPPTSPAVRWGHRTVAVGIGRALHRYLFTPTGPSPVPSNRCRRRRRRRRSFSRFCIEYQSNVLLLFLDFTVRLRVGAFTGVQRFQMARTQRECPAWLPTGRPSGVKADGPVAADTPVLRKAFGTSGGRPDVLRMAQGRLDFFETLTQGLGGGGQGGGEALGRVSTRGPP